MSQSAPWSFTLPSRYVSEDGIDGLVNGLSPLVRDFRRYLARQADIKGVPLGRFPKFEKPVTVALDGDKFFEGGRGGDHEAVRNGSVQRRVEVDTEIMPSGHRRISFKLRRVTLP